MERSRILRIRKLKARKLIEEATKTPEERARERERITGYEPVM
ncbi:unnamed protein product [marine sediment metagenome]|uniref:Uncharacterized protein n=1 Tax=marine sediment metagenome TaxID=412755 RepID=X1JKZ5_9ZZZZ